MNMYITKRTDQELIITEPKKKLFDYLKIFLGFDKFTYKSQNFLGSKTQQYRLNEINQLESNTVEIDSDTFYKLELVLSSGKRYSIIRATKSEQAESIKQEIEDFIPILLVRQQGKNSR